MKFFKLIAVVIVCLFAFKVNFAAAQGTPSPEQQALAKKIVEAKKQLDEKESRLKQLEAAAGAGTSTNPEEDVKEAEKLGSEIAKLKLLLAALIGQYCRLPGTRLILLCGHYSLAAWERIAEGESPYPLGAGDPFVVPPPQEPLNPAPNRG